MVDAGTGEASAEPEEMSITGVVVRTVIGAVVLLVVAAFIWQAAAAVYVGVFVLGAVLDVIGRLPRGRRRSAGAVLGWWFLRPPFVVALVLEGIAELFTGL